MRSDVYQKITNQIVSALEQGVRPWHQPWNAEHSAGRITRPLRGNGVAYQGINTVMLWSAAIAKGYAAPIWMTYRQAQELGAHVRKGEEGSLVVYADKIIRTETDAETGEEAEPVTCPRPTTSTCRASISSAMLNPTTPRLGTRKFIALATKAVSTATSGGSASATKAMRWRNCAPSLVRRSFAPTSN